jgi:hypothetical protein
MKKTLAALLMAAVSFNGCGKTEPELTRPAVQEAPKPRPVRRLPESESEAPIRKLIEKEIRKNDNWVLDVLRQDYTTAEGTGWVSLVYEEKEKSENFIGHNAAFDSKNDLLILPIDKSGDHKPLADAIDHELWHAIYDSTGEKGIFFHGDFKGPANTELEAHCAEKMKLPDYAALRAKVELDLRRDSVNRKINLLSEIHGSKLKGTFAILQSIGKDYKAISPDLWNYIKGDVHEQMKNALTPIEESYTNLREAYQKTAQWNKSLANVDPETIDDKTLDQVEKDLEMHTNAMKPYSNLLAEARAANEKFYSLIFDAEDKLHLAKTAQLKELLEKSEGNEKQEYEEDLAHEKRMHALRANIRDVKMHGMALPDTSLTAEIINQMCADSNKRSMNAIFTTDEIMARIVNSVYSLHFGKPDLHNFTPGEEDLKLMERCAYKGQPLFRKGTEKYRLGMQMIKDGMTPENVKEQLEYATKFSYKGKEYSWPETDFSIKGGIPHAKKD